MRPPPVNGVRQNFLARLARRVGLVAQPVAQRRAERVHRTWQIQLPVDERLRCPVRQQAAVIGREQVIGRRMAFAHDLEDAERGVGQRHNMGFAVFHPSHRDFPDGRVVVDLRPPRPQRLRFGSRTASSTRGRARGRSHGDQVGEQRRALGIRESPEMRFLRSFIPGELERVGCA